MPQDVTHELRHHMLKSAARNTDIDSEAWTPNTAFLETAPMETTIGCECSLLAKRTIHTHTFSKEQSSCVTRNKTRMWWTRVDTYSWGRPSRVLLPQQLARRTTQRLARNGLPLPQQSAPWTPQRRKGERTEVPEQRDSQHEAPVMCDDLMSSTLSHCGRQGRRDILLRRVKSSIFMPSKPSEPTKLISLSKCPVFPTNALFFNLFKRSKAMMLKLPVEEQRKRHLDTFKARLQGAEGVRFGNLS